MIKPNLFTSPVPLGQAKATAPDIRAVPPKKAGTSATQVVPFIDGAYEKKQFYKTMLVSFAVFSVISAALVGMALYAKVGQGGDQPPTTTQLIRQDDDVLRTVGAEEQSPVRERPLTGPTIVPTPVFAGYSVPVLTQPVITVPVIPGKKTTPTTTINPLTPTRTTTPTPTSLLSVTPTPTSVLYLSTESTSNQVNFGNVSVNTELTTQVTMRNIGANSITINAMFFSTVGATNPFIIQSGSASTPCLTNSDLPYTLGSNESRCILFKYTPSSTSINTNIFLMYWNTSFAKSITLNGTVTTPTPTPTMTPTVTVTPTPIGNFYLSSEATSGQVNFGSLDLGMDSSVQIMLHNVDGVDITVSDAYLATYGDTNPFVIEAGPDSCVTSFPYTFTAYSTKCLRFNFDPGAYTVNENYFLMYWNTRLLKSIKLFGVLITPTPTITPTP